MMDDKALRQLFVKDIATGKIRFTRKGVEAFREDFARVGIDITQITTPAQFRAASDASYAYEMHRSAAALRGKDPHLEAIMRALPGWN
jgi:hypothetical protein